jgi:hypothetical protein
LEEAGVWLMKWRACVMLNPEKPNVWNEVQANSFEELLKKLKVNNREPFRIIIFKSRDKNE